MNILIFNCGSSSQSFKVYQGSSADTAFPILSGKASNVATQTRANASITWQYHGKTVTKKYDLLAHRSAAEEIIKIVKEYRIEITAIGHRFVHGGTLFSQTTKIDPETMKKLQRCFPFAPIHNPNSFSVIEVCGQQLPDVPQYAIFDTAFHAGMPDASKQYAIPTDLAAKYGFHKFGFHGLSYQFVSAKAAEVMEKPLESLKLIICHLGSGGSSVVAVKDGASIDTSMGYSPLPGLVMSTRCGDIDAEIVLALIRKGYSPDEVSDILNNQSGLIGLSGFSSNLQEIIVEAEQRNADCQLAYEMYAHRLQIYLGAYTWLLNGSDAIIFTDTIGTTSWKLREKVCSQVNNIGVEIDSEKNKKASGDSAELVSGDNSRTQIWVIPTDEESVILREVFRKL
ncbi:MAG: acetate/propionate family kinase [Anaerolineaceae bacterium]